MQLPLYGRFVGGRSIQDAISRTLTTPWIPIFDWAKEGNNDIVRVRKDVDRIKKDIQIIKKHGIDDAFYALKASTFAVDNRAIPMLSDVAKDLKDNGVKIVFDAELSHMTEFEDRCIDQVIDFGAPIYKTYQMYRRDAVERLMKDLGDGKVKKVKLVRGAYMHQEKTHLIHPTKKHVDHAFDVGVKVVLSAMYKDEDINIIIATHNDQSVRKAMELIQHSDIQRRVYFAQLLGMADALSHHTSQQGYNTCKYVPYGSFIEVFPYLSRRLYENHGILKHVK
jgi:proline dehydrogenase